MDLASADSVQSAVAQIDAMFGTVDLLVNNGAGWLENRPPFEASQVLDVVNSAVSGTYLLTQGLLPLLERSPGGDIVIIGSVTGLPNASLRTASVPFYAAKRAQAALAEGFAQQLANSSVRIITVHPPDLDDISPLAPEWERAADRTRPMRASNRDVVESVLFAIGRARNIALSIVIDGGAGGFSIAHSPPRPS